MTDEPLEVEVVPISNAPIVFSPAEALLTELRESCKDITIATHGEKAVGEARIACKKRRVQIENKRKELKEDALAYGRKVDAEAKRLTSIIEPTEKRLQAEEDALAERRAREVREAEERKRAQTQRRVTIATALGAPVNILKLQDMTPSEFAVFVEEATAAKEQREAAAQAEQERIKKERAALEEERRQARLEAEQAARERDAARLELEAAKQARYDAEVKLENERRRDPPDPIPVMHIGGAQLSPPKDEWYDQDGNAHDLSGMPTKEQAEFIRSMSPPTNVPSGEQMESAPVCPTCGQAWRSP